MSAQVAGLRAIRYLLNLVVYSKYIPRFKLSSQYPLSAFAMVNVRDLAGITNAWKLLISPGMDFNYCVYCVVSA